jgi:N-ethylmaleimide reductase
MMEYYVQRASAGLIVTECTQVSDQGHGIIRAPGLHRQDQVDAWRPIVDGVHAAGGRIFCQLWHCGRVSHPDIRTERSRSRHPPSQHPGASISRRPC